MFWCRSEPCFQRAFPLKHRYQSILRLRAWPVWGTEKRDQISHVHTVSTMDLPLVSALTQSFCRTPHLVSKYVFVSFASATCFVRSALESRLCFLFCACKSLHFIAMMMSGSKCRCLIRWFLSASVIAWQIFWVSICFVQVILCRWACVQEGKQIQWKTAQENSYNYHQQQSSVIQVFFLIHAGGYLCTRWQKAYDLFCRRLMCKVEQKTFGVTGSVSL